MVQLVAQEIPNIVQVSSAETEANLKNATSTTNSNSNNNNNNKEPVEIDHALIGEARRQLREAFEEADETGGQQVYAVQHYQRLMDEKAPLTCWRYLHHCGRQLGPAVDLMKRALKWRQENQVDQLTRKQLAKDIFLKAPAGITGRTRDGQAIFYIMGKGYRKPDPSVKMTVRKFITFGLLEFDNIHRDDMEQLVAIFDVTDTTYANMDLDFITWLISVRDFFPARFKSIEVVGIPFLIRPIIKLIISWLPEAYKQITHCGTFEQLVLSQADKDQLPSEVGGTADDSWRLSPPDTPWASETDEFNEELMQTLDKAINFTKSEEEVSRLFQLQRDHDARATK